MGKSKNLGRKKGVDKLHLLFYTSGSVNDDCPGKDKVNIVNYSKKYNLFFEKGKRMFVPNKAERLYLLEHVGHKPYVLYEEYMARKADASFSDEAIHRALPCYSVRTIATARKALKKAGFYKEVRFYDKAGKISMIQILLGKEGVSNKAELQRGKNKADKDILDGGSK